MNDRRSRGVGLVMAVLCIFCTVFGHAQIYRFNAYGINEGMPQQYVYTITQDSTGYLWAGTGEGLARFDGSEFRTYKLRDGLAEDFVTCVLPAEKGEIWVGHNRGSISKGGANGFRVVYQDSLVSSAVTAIFPAYDKAIYAVLQNGYLLHVSAEGDIMGYDLTGGQDPIWTAALSPVGDLLIGTNTGLYTCVVTVDGVPGELKPVEQVAGDKVAAIERSKHDPFTYWIGTTTSGLYQLQYIQARDYRVRNSGGDFQLMESNIQDIFEDRERNLWVSSFLGLYKLEWNDAQEGHERVVIFNQPNGLNDFVKTAFQDREGNIWAGLYGEGLAMLADEFFTFYQYADERYSNDTRCFLFEDDVKWFGTGNGLLKVDPGTQEKRYFYSVDDGLGSGAITALLKSDDGGIWVGTESTGLHKMKEGKITPLNYTDDPLGNSINDIESDGTLLWLATKGGVYAVDPATGMANHFTTESGLVHNNIYDVHFTTDERILISTHGNMISVLNEGEIYHLPVSEEQSLMDITAIGEDGNGQLWVATSGNGIFQQEGGGFTHYNSNDGLKSDYCYSMVVGANNDVWVGHRGGVSKVNTVTKLIEVFDSKYGITSDCNSLAAYSDKENNLWFGTNTGSMKFDPEKYAMNSVPPAINLRNIYLSDQEIGIQSYLSLPFGTYKLRIDYIGITFRQPENVKYQFFLEGYDLDWSDPTSLNSAPYPRISDGEYTFYVKACNSDGACSEQVAAFKLTIATPFYKKWWFYTICVLVLFGAVILIIRIRERNQRAFQQYLERQLALRQAEVLEKNEQLEEKNRNITDSITYALRIQKSILPDESILQDAFPESFIYYLPRDIVSGDFYWYQWIKDRFVVVCADCTGHGVPGAFLSMISSTIFKEIAGQHQITDPAEFLFKVDDILKTTLKQGITQSNYDGLDMAICSFDVKNKVVEYAGAVRPVVFYHQNEFHVMKTCTDSIGGFYEHDKAFETQRMQLNEGDSVYMFSDGFTDQFGGERSRKIQLKGLLEVIENNIDNSMSDQQKALETKLHLWMANENQIDDVLVMGLKIS